MIDQDRFNWDITKKELVIFMPNWGRGDYIRKTVSTIQTDIDTNRWIILAANDGIHEDLSDLNRYNVVYFTLKRENSKERNGCFIRNFVISRCQSEILFSKDPEVIINGDFIKHCLNCNKDWYRLGHKAYKSEKGVTEKYMRGDCGKEELMARATEHPISSSSHNIMHYGYGIKTQILKDMRGYDEDYSISPYCEDRDLFYRLKSKNIPVYMDKECFPIHLWHEMKFFPDKPENIKMYEKSKQLFSSKSPHDFIRNQDREWGTGRPDIGSFCE